MLVKSWKKLPSFMQEEEIVPYYNKLRRKNFYLCIKRFLDILFSLTLLLLLSLFFLIFALLIKLDSKGPVFYRQERITQYGKVFKIHKFRTMKVGADKNGLLTTSNDSRVTKIGKFLRKTHLDETAQLIDVLKGDMTFVGTRPEVQKYVDKYTPKMKATLLLPAGITSTASFRYKDENELIDGKENVDEIYINKILVDKMKFNLEDVEKVGFFRDISRLFLTFFHVFIK